MIFKRASGILLHPTSLPGPCGIGDLGPAAFQFVDFLAETGTALWQVLPLGPTGYGDSPYQCFSAFAGNPYLISPDALLEDGLLYQEDLADPPPFPADRVDYGAVIPWKLHLLNTAYRRFRENTLPPSPIPNSQSPTPTLQSLAVFRRDHAAWLDDFALFMAIKEHFGCGAWTDWPAPLRRRDPAALAAFADGHAEEIERHAFWQFLFFRQWEKLRAYARQRGITLIGDIPIFVAHDSADVWAHPELFFLDDDGSPAVVAGVPPDYFSPAGQLWGNPLYRWEVHKRENYAWWIARLRSVLSLVDLVRLDHFRGFAAYWEVPGEAETAENGRWAPGPGADFLAALRESLGIVETPVSRGLPIIAEDLGVITPDVDAMRREFDLPGMKVLVFAFDGDPENVFLPHNYTRDCVVYTGTHDNDTALGWYQRVGEKERDFARRYLARDGHDIAWDLIRAAWGSVAVFAIAPMQDLLGLDNRARMNYPGNPSGNWSWRMSPGVLDAALRARLRETNFLYGRLAG